MTAQFVDLYAELVAAGVQLDNHESDLYVRVTDESRRIIKASGYSYTVFTSAIDGVRWFDVPFAYHPWWAKRQTQRSQA